MALSDTITKAANTAFAAADDQPVAVQLFETTASTYTPATDTLAETRTPIAATAIKYQRKIMFKGVETDTNTYLIRWSQVLKEIQSDWAIRETGDTQDREIMVVERPHPSIFIVHTVRT